MQGRMTEAVEIWQRIFARYPWMSEVGINLLRAQPSNTAVRQRLKLYHPTLPTAP